MALLAVAFMLQPLAKRSVSRTRGMVRLPILAGIIVVILAISLYSFLGRPDMVTETVHSTATKPGTGKTDGVPSVASLLTGLEERLQNSPDDGKGWLLLAKTYQHLGRNHDARIAYDKAVALGQTDTAFAESIENSSTAQIRGHVSISDEARTLISADDSVFIFARAIDGPPMPLAVVQRPATDLPFDFVLSDAQAMVPDNVLSAAKMVTVTAKISAPKDALRSVANLEVRSAAVPTANSPYLELVIGAAQ
ncbi:MAG: hypothetical protein OEV69_05165 [Gammaproteobacteria bacterium]|nr:hypothetical protein [Gammaproteobacteria bacterium]